MYKDYSRHTPRAIGNPQVREFGRALAASAHANEQQPKGRNEPALPQPIWGGRLTRYNP